MMRKKHSFRQNSTVIGYAFLAPFLILFFIFVVIPVIIAIGMSLTSYDMVNSPTFVGLNNFKRLLIKDDVFMLSVKNTFIFALFIGPIGYIVSFLMAWVLGNLKARSLFSMSFYIPSIVSTVAITTVWLFIFSNDRMGLVNNMLMTVGLIDEPILWTQNGKYIFIAVIIISVWMSMGNGFLVFLAGLQGLPTEIYESARIDGVKNKWQELWYITLPLMKSVIIMMFIMAVGRIFYSDFGLFYQVPKQSSSLQNVVTTLDVYVYNMLKSSTTGMASAAAFVQSVAGCITILLANGIVRKIDPDSAMI